MNRLKTWYFAQSINAQSVVVFLSTIVSAAIIFLFASWQMNREGTKSMEPYAKSQRLIDTHLDSMERPQYLPQKYFQLFKSQQRIMSVRKEHYLGLSKIFFRNYYGVLIIKMLYSCIGAIALFLLVKEGWGPSSHILKSFFLAVVTIVTFCSFFPLVFKQEENFNMNIKYYMDYTKAEINIVDQLSRLDNPIFPCNIDTEDKKTCLPDSVTFFRRVDSMISVNNNTINNLTNYVMTIDANEIKSMGEIYKMIYNSTSGNVDSLKGK